MKVQSSKLPALVLTALICAAALISCGGGGGGSDSCVNIAGTWYVTETVGYNTCGTASGVPKYNVYSVTQSGCGFTASDGSHTFKGSASGNDITWTGSYVSDSGTVTINTNSIIVSTDGNSISGLAPWTWSDGSGHCSGTTSMSGGRQSTAPNVDATGTWSGAWKSVANQDLTGKFTATVMQTGTTLSGTIDVPYLNITNAHLQGTVQGNIISFGDVNFEISFSGAMSGDSASGTYVHSDDDYGTWSAVRQASTPMPTFSSIAVSPTSTSVAVAGTAQFSATGIYSDATSTVLTGGVDWQSDNTGVATIDGNGLATGVIAGVAHITASKNGVTSPAATLTVITAPTTTVVPLTFGTDLPYSGSVDTTAGYYKVTGLSAGSAYAISLTSLTDDADLFVYSDAYFSSWLCVSAHGPGTISESCNATANTSGELYVEVDGQWTSAGAAFTLNVAAAAVTPLNATLAFGTNLPYSGSVDTTARYYKVTGLSAGSVYTVSLTSLTDDADLFVYADAYFSSWLCGSANGGTTSESCNAEANSSGELYIEVDGSWSQSGAAFVLNANAL